MWPFSSKARTAPKPQLPIFFTNTLSKRKELFSPLKPGVVTMYTCGPTVYSKATIGNMRAYIFADLIVRTLRSADYHVRQVINITDVGHLVSDGDDGEDKVEMSAKAEGLSVEELTGRYTKLFIDDLAALNVDTSTILFPRATEYIAEQIRMIQELEKKGYTYQTHDGIYFDTSKFEGYGKLGGISEAELKTGDAMSLEDRVTIAAGRRILENKDKRHPADFALWKFSSLKDKRLQEWPSLWGRGFPGWHIECSAMIRAILGNEIDIHTGGIDHIPIHHNNEIAQSEGVLGRQFVRTWMHGAFITIEGVKISKSLKNDFYVSDFIDRGYHPLAYRYFLLQAHYRSPLSFSWEALAASAEGLTRLWRLCASIMLDSKGISVPTEASERILTLLHDDLGTPQALAYLWEVLRDEDILPKEKRAVIEAAEPILGLSLLKIPEFARLFTPQELPDVIQSLIKDREKARMAGEYEKADTIREKLRNRGYHVDDRPEGPLLTLLPK